MRKIAIGIVVCLLCVLVGVFLGGCALEINTPSAKNKGVIECVKGEDLIRPSIFRDTETGHEYVVFRYGESVTVTPRLPISEKLGE